MGGKDIPILQLCSLELPLLASCLLCLCTVFLSGLWLHLCVFPWCFPPFEPKVFKVRPQITCWEDPLGNHTGVSQSISQSVSLPFSLPWLVCVKSVPFCLPLNLLSAPDCPGVTLPVFKSWPSCVTLGKQLTGSVSSSVKWVCRSLLHRVVVRIK